MKNKVWLILLCVLLLFIPFCREKNSLDLHLGDLLFQDLDCGDLCDAIEKVTPGYKGKHFSHVGMLAGKDKGEWIVIEAYPPQVQLTPYSEFVQRSTAVSGNSNIVVGRLKEKHRQLILSAIKHSKKYLDKPYDKEFLINNDAYYCAELLYFAFKEANQGKEIFSLQPMTFKDPLTKEIMPVWHDYYKKLNMRVPEGEMGINPGLIAISSEIQKQNLSNHN